jgi:hypothetical protein
VAASRFASGRAGQAQIEIQIEGLFPTLNKWAKADPMFNKEIRAASIELINELVVEVKKAAATAPNPRQATEAAKGFRARPDRIPIIRLDAGSNFVSTTRPNRKRKTKVTRGDVFFGSEFGSKNFKQFPDRSAPFGAGNRGYYFWPTIEDKAESIRDRYLEALDRITAKLARM